MTALEGIPAPPGRRVDSRENRQRPDRRSISLPTETYELLRERCLRLGEAMSHRLELLIVDFLDTPIADFLPGSPAPEDSMRLAPIVPAGVELKRRPSFDPPLDVVVIVCEGKCSTWTPHTRDAGGGWIYRCTCCDTARRFGS